LLWGLQIAFLSPALALILVTLYDASTAEVGWILTVYNASGFIASLLVPSYADRREDYLRPMLACGVLTLVLALVLAFTTSLPVAVNAHLRHSGAKPTDIVNTRAIVSVAWIAGPPLATLIMGAFGNRAILFAIGTIAVLIIATTALMISQRSAAPEHGSSAPHAEDDHLALRTRAVVLIVAAFVLLQAANATVTSIMTLFVTQTMHINVIWAGIALGVAAGLEVPALVLIGRLSIRFSSLGLIMTGCVAGIAYYLAMAYVSGPVMLIAVQPLNAWCFAAIAGVGLTLFQQMIPRPGLSTGLYMNTRRVGAIVSGPIIAIGSTTALGNRGIFLACGLLIVLALIVITTAARQREPRPTADLAQ
jgi:SET family sugar efflux transporter-like MFS transporter